MNCDNCDGTGQHPTDPKKSCDLCEGSGMLCDVCGEACEEWRKGAGREGRDTCKSCAFDEDEEEN